MSNKHSPPRTGSAETGAQRAVPRFEARILQLVQGTRERRAIAQGEVDAILDPASGRAILLPDAQSALVELKRHFRSLVALACDGYWEQDEHHRFTACNGTALGAANCTGTLGRALWDLEFERGDSSDWQTLRLSLAQHRVFRDFELAQRDGDGVLRHLSLSGEPKFDGDGRFRGYRGITRDLTATSAPVGQGHAQGLLARATLNALPTPVCLLNAAGVIVALNSAWQRSTTTPFTTLAVGSHYQSAWGTQPALAPFATAAIGAGLAQVAAGGRAVFRFELDFETDGQQCCLEVTASALHAGDATQLMLSHEDITLRKRRAQWQVLESAVAGGLAVAPDARAGLLAVLAAVCEAWHWDCGQYFEHDASSASLSHVAQWSGAHAAEVSEFLARSPSSPFRAHAGLSGRVCQARQPLWLRDADSDERLAHALPHEVGLRGVFMLPVSADDALYGVLAFGSRAGISEPDEACLRAVANIGHLLGHFLRREGQVEQLRRSEQRYARYTALGCDWHFETDSELRLVASNAGGLGGVTDLTGRRLWEVPALQVSEDEWARLKAEMAARWSFCDFACSAVMADGRESRYHLSGEPIFDEAGVFQGFLGIGLNVTQRPR